MVISDTMAEAEHRNEVLAFLLGSTPLLDPPSAASSVEAEDDLPEMEDVSDSDIESNEVPSSDVDPSTGETDQPTASEAVLDAVESLLEETEVPTGKQNGGEICKEDPNVEVSNTAVAEHEYDCAASTTDAGTPQPERLEKTQLKKEKAQVQKNLKSGAAMKTKATKVRRGSAQVATSISPVTTKKDLSTETKLKEDGDLPTFEEFLFVGCVSTVLVLYLVACVYSFFHPLVVPLPDYEELYSAYDISNVSVHIVNPMDNSQITPQGVFFEWKLANFPKEALHLYGAEVFRYRVSLDDEVVTEEIEFLTIQEEDHQKEVLNRTVRFPIPLRKFTHDEDGEPNRLFKLHLDVAIPIPGLIEELKTFEQDVYVRKPSPPSPEDGVHLTLTSPLNDTIFELNQPIVLEYTAVNVHNMEVLFDDDVYVKKTLVEDGNLLLRALGAGPHKFEIRAVNEQSEVVATSTVCVVITERLDTEAT